MPETIGQQLAAARIERGLEIEDVAHKTRIHRDFVRHLENDEYDQLPNLMFVRGFLKIYSQFVGVDASLALAQLTAADTHHGDQYLLGGVSPSVRERFGKLTSRIPVRPILATAAAAVVITIGGTYLVSHLYGSGANASGQVAAEPRAPVSEPELIAETATEPVGNPAPETDAPAVLATAPIDTTIPEKLPIDPASVPKAAPVIRKAEPVEETDAGIEDEPEEVYAPYEVTPGIVDVEE